MECDQGWLPEGYDHPMWVDLPSGVHLRPIRATDVDIDYPAVMGSQARLWTIFGAAWGWPPASMTYQHDAEDLARHEREIAEHASFNYALLDSEETRLLGCVYIDPPERQGADADISWWVVDEFAETALDRELAGFVASWIKSAWPFESPRLIGRDISMSAWLDLPEP
jgi:hypothetical protein